jgi:hypothetical protein
MGEKLPRAIPEVSVRLDKFAKTKDYENFVNREFLPESLSGAEKVTLDVDDYTDHNTGKAVDGKENLGKPTWRPRMFVSSTNGEPDIVSIGDYVVLKPSVTDQGTLIAGVTDKSATDLPDVEAILRLVKDPPKIKLPNLWPGDDDTIINVFPQSAIDAILNAQSNYLFEATDIAAQFQLRSNGGSGGQDFHVQRYLLNVPSVPTPQKIRIGFDSVHKLAKNQPFAFSVRSKKQKIDSDFSTFANNDEEFNTRSWSVFYPKATRQQSAIEVEWGGGLNGRFKLVIRNGAKSVVLFRRHGQQWKQYSDVNSVPVSAKSDWTDVMVYPVGRQIIVLFGGEINAAAIKNNALIYNLDSEVDIESGNISVNMYGAMMDFKYKNVIHAKEGYLISPPFNCGLEEVGNAWTNLDYIGKTNVGRDTSVEETNFPLTDAEKEAEQKKNENVDLDKLESTSFGEFDVRTAESLPKENTDAGNSLEYQLLTENLESGLISQMTGDEKEAAEFYPDSKNKDGQIIRYLKYAIKMVSNSGTQETLRIMSPAVETMQVMALAKHGTINLNPAPQIIAADVVHVSIQESLESLSATVTLNNRKPFGAGTKGIYTYDYDQSNPDRDKESNFVGVKPITIRGGIQDGANFVSRKMLEYIDPVEDFENIEQPVRFRGYIVGREYSRPGSGSSTVTLHCEDCSRRAKDKITMNLPIFDGWCNLAVMYYLARDAGYPIEDIIIQQDPHDPSKFTTLYDLLVEAKNTNPEKFEGPCFGGHTEGVPEGSKILKGLGAEVSSNVLHAMMPLNIYKQQPNYMFPAGQNSWDCMAAIREFTGFYLYPNAFGKIVYQPPEVAFKTMRSQTGKSSSDDISGGRGSVAPPGPKGEAPKVLTYYEVPRIKGQHNPLGYNQFQGSFDTAIQTDDIRNALALFGLIQVSSSNDPKKLDAWSPHIVVKRPTDLAADIAKPWFVPWLRWTIVKNPHWSDPRRNDQLAQELYNRLRRVHLHTKFSLWGSPAHYAYMVFIVDESLMNETGANKLQFVTTQISHEFDARSLTYRTSVSGEHLDFNIFDFAPHVSGRPLAAYTPGWKPGKKPISGKVERQ